MLLITAIIMLLEEKRIRTIQPTKLWKITTTNESLVKVTVKYYSNKMETLIINKLFGIQVANLNLGLNCI